MTSPPAAKKQAVSSIIHQAPVGRRYSSIKDAGKTLLDTNFNGFLDGKSHEIIPPILLNNFPEEVDSKGLIVPGPGFGQSDLEGENNEKMGEDLEIRFFQQIEKVFGMPLAVSGFPDPELFWRGLTIPKYKMEALLREHPEVTLKVEQFQKKYTAKNSTTFGESDMIVLIRNVGLIVVEIKRSIKKIKDGIKQCNRMQNFASLVFETCSSDITLPIVKVVIVGQSKKEASRIVTDSSVNTSPTIEKSQTEVNEVKEEPTALPVTVEEVQDISILKGQSQPDTTIGLLKCGDAKSKSDIFSKLS